MFSIFYLVLVVLFQGVPAFASAPYIINPTDAYGMQIPGELINVYLVQLKYLHIFIELKFWERYVVIYLLQGARLCY